MRGNFILLFPIFIFSLFNFFPYIHEEEQRNCNDLKIFAEVGSTCFDSGNGSISLQLKGGIPPYKIEWADGKTAARLKGLQAGTYAVTITDSNGCRSKESIHVKSYRPLAASVKELPSTIEAGNGSLEIKVTGGDPPYTYNWIGASGIANQTNTSADKISNLRKGNYTIAVTDSNRCTSVFNATVR